MYVSILFFLLRGAAISLAVSLFINYYNIDLSFKESLFVGIVCGLINVCLGMPGRADDDSTKD